MTAERLRQAAAKLRERDKKADRRLAFWFEHLACRISNVDATGGPPAEQDLLHAVGVADAVLGEP